MSNAAHRIAALAILAVAVALTLYPVAWMLSASLKQSREIFSTSLFSLGTAGFKNYLSAFGQRPFFLYLFNSVLASGISVLLTLVLSALAGYGFAKFPHRLAPLFWIVVLVSVMIPLEAIVIPLFLEVHAFGWTNTYAGLILPTAFNVVGIFIFRQAMVSIPDAYIEAARIDGAGELRILLSVILPMVLPTAGVVAILTFNLTWNSYLWPLIVASDDSLRTLPLGMAAFQAGFNTQYGEVMAVSVFGALPTAIFFLCLQRYFVEGAVASGVK
ncbi:carbohydrate ABC transporter permease [Ensifer soli]|uniref:carbohydrate ABC transporter permease n=1 Tax=Ciceribacter sp. sgz301302 TaxID=3342379 RepID=UPI0035BB18C4